MSPVDRQGGEATPRASKFCDRCSACGHSVRRIWGAWSSMYVGHHWGCKRIGRGPDV